MNNSVEQLNLIKQKIITAAENRALSYNMMYYLTSNMTIFIDYIKDNDIDIFSFDYGELHKAMIDYKHWLNSEYKSTRVNSNMKVIDRMFKTASDLEIMRSSIYHLIKLDDIFYIKPQPKKKQPVITEQEFKEVVGRLSHTDRLTQKIRYRYILTKALLYFMFYTGCRLSEALNVKKSDIKRLESEYDGMLEIEILGKGNKYRTVYANDLVAKAIAEHIAIRSDKHDDCDNVFALEAYRNRRTKNYRSIYNNEGIALLNEAYKIAGLDYGGAHVLRRGFASTMLKEGATLKEIQELLGHTDIKTTMLYLEIEDATKRSTYNKIMVARVEAEQKRERATHQYNA